MIALADAAEDVAIEPSYDERLLAIKSSAAAMKVIESAIDKIPIAGNRRQVEHDIEMKVRQIMARAASECFKEIEKISE